MTKKALLHGTAETMTGRVLRDACIVIDGGKILSVEEKGTAPAGCEVIDVAGAVVFLGASQTLRMNEHVRVDVIYSSLSERGRMWLDLWGFIFLFMPAVTYFFVLSLPFFAASVASGEYSSNAGGLLLWPVKLLLPAGFGLLLAQGLSEIVKRIAGLSGHSHFHPHYEKPLQ